MAKKPHLEYTRDGILAKNRISVANVESLSVKAPTSVNTAEFTVEKDLMSVWTVGKPSGATLVFSGTREHTRENGRTNVVTAEDCLDRSSA